MKRSSMRLSILDVGHGNAAVLQDGRSVVVVDAGPGSALLEFLDRERIRRIDVLLLSHADKDHIEGVVGLLASSNVTIGHVRLNSDAAKESKLWDDLLFELDEANRRGTLKFDVSLTESHSGQFDTRAVRVEIVGPSPYLAGRGPGSKDRRGRVLTANSMSAVIRLVTRSHSPVALLCGDVDEVGLDNLMQAGKDLSAEVMVFPHHGGGGSPSLARFVGRLCTAVRPRTVVFSLGRGMFETPRPEVVTAVRRTLPKARIVCTQLSEHCSATAPSGGAGHLTELFALGRERGHCCGGTVAVDGSGKVGPATRAHRRFIAREAPTALCLRAETATKRSKRRGRARAGLSRRARGGRRR